jgi:ERCC4-type nuclease
MSERASKAEPTIIVDTREQTPLTFLNSQRGTLETGDYSALGYEHLVSVERKSVPDLFGCVGAQRERFERELERLSAFPYCAIVVEATMRDILLGAHFSTVHPHAALGSLIAWGTKYRIPVWLCGDRVDAALTVRKILHAAVKYHDAGKGEDAR